jgi:DNA-binding NtrC family response regulator
LYFRLKVIGLRMPALKERKEDIPLLMDHYATQMNRVYGRNVQAFTEAAKRLFMAYHWPGNVRELRNVVEALYITCPSGEFSVDDLSAYLLEAGAEDLVSEEERDRLVAALCSANWNKSRAAKELCWSRMTLYRKMRKYHLTEHGGPPETADRTARVLQDL